MKVGLRNTILVMFCFVLPFAEASELEIPHTFENGQVTSATEMNANFEAIKAAVNDNHNRIFEQRTQFVGFSSATFDGSGGLFAMQQACHILVPQSHMCDTSELSGSAYSASALQTIENSDDNAWIRYKVAGFDAERTVIDENALQPATAFAGNSGEGTSCRGWKDDQAIYQGLIVRWNGSFSTQDCGRIAKVACCK